MPGWLPILIPAFPLLACIVTPVLGPRRLKEQSHWPCVVGAGLALLLSLVFLVIVLVQGPAASDTTTAYDWIRVGTAEAPLLDIPIVLRADSLSAIMVVTVTLIGSIIAVYSIGYMRDDPGYWRYFSEIALFIFSMTMLVLASNFLLLYVFWEAVGLCSYLLIGFWYQRPAAAAAGKKAFLVNRIGDFGFAIGVFLIWTTFGSLDYDAVFDAEHIAAAGSGTVLTICLLLFAGAIGKSAQFPLHVWLPDAMEGPTPVSALIHAATMVTAGVYLVARCTPLFAAAETARMVVAAIGGFTALLAALIALTQNDLKRVLAYSTISQLGYMFVGLGVGSLAGVAAGMFHLFTHAFFKALLFLGAGSVMHAMGGVIDMGRFRGLRNRLPTTHWTFAVGAAALAGFPLLSGFWSKDAILEALQHPAVSPSVPDWWASLYRVIFWVATFTAFLTAFYVFRAFFRTFWGPEQIPDEAAEHAHEAPPVMTWPLLILAGGSAIVGLIFGPTGWFAGFLSWTPHMAMLTEGHAATEAAHALSVPLMSSLLALLGIGLAWWMYGTVTPWPEVFAKWLRPLFTLSYKKFYFDELYERIVVKPSQGLAAMCRWADGLLIDGLVNLVARIPPMVGRFGVVMHNGQVQFYAVVMLTGLVLLLWMVVNEGPW